MSNLELHQFNCLQDNFGFLLNDKEAGVTVSIDAPDGLAVEAQLKKRGWHLTHIFTTHHHNDHVDGNLYLKELYGCEIIGPKLEANKIPGIDSEVLGDDKFMWAGHEIIVHACPGHTSGQIAFNLPEENILFSADTLFAMGCGRVFEGTMDEMFLSVNQFKSLPPNTKIYFGHDYTKTNCKFALSLEPGNQDLQKRAHAIFSKGDTAWSTTIAEELKTNPFMRCESLEIREALGLQSATDNEVFTAIRVKRNSFKV